MKPAPRTLAAQLWALSHGGLDQKGLDEIPHLAASGRTSMPVDKEIDKGLYRARRLPRLRRAGGARRHPGAPCRHHPPGHRLSSRRHRRRAADRHGRRRRLRRHRADDLARRLLGRGFRLDPRGSAIAARSARGGDHQPIRLPAATGRCTARLAEGRRRPHDGQACQRGRYDADWAWRMPRTAWLPATAPTTRPKQRPPRPNDPIQPDPVRAASPRSRRSGRCGLPPKQATPPDQPRGGSPTSMSRPRPSRSTVGAMQGDVRPTTGERDPADVAIEALPLPPDPSRRTRPRRPCLTEPVPPGPRSSPMSPIDAIARTRRRCGVPLPTRRPATGDEARDREVWRRPGSARSARPRAAVSPGAAAGRGRGGAASPRTVNGRTAKGDRRGDRRAMDWRSRWSGEKRRRLAAEGRPDDERSASAPSATATSPARGSRLGPGCREKLRARVPLGATPLRATAPRQD